MSLISISTNGEVAVSEDGKNNPPKNSLPKQAPSPTAREETVMMSPTDFLGGNVEPEKNPGSGNMPTVAIDYQDFLPPEMMQQLQKPTPTTRLALGIRPLSQAANLKPPVPPVLPESMPASGIMPLSQAANLKQSGQPGAQEKKSLMAGEEPNPTRKKITLDLHDKARFQSTRKLQIGLLNNTGNTEATSPPPQPMGTQGGEIPLDVKTFLLANENPLKKLPIHETTRKSLVPIGQETAKIEMSLQQSQNQEHQPLDIFKLSMGQAPMVPPTGLVRPPEIRASVMAANQETAENNAVETKSRPMPPILPTGRPVEIRQPLNLSKEDAEETQPMSPPFLGMGPNMVLGKAHEVRSSVSIPSYKPQESGVDTKARAVVPILPAAGPGTPKSLEIKPPVTTPPMEVRSDTKTRPMVLKMPEIQLSVAAASLGQPGSPSPAKSVETGSGSATKQRPAVSPPMMLKTSPLVANSPTTQPKSIEPDSRSATKNRAIPALPATTPATLPQMKRSGDGMKVSPMGKLDDLPNILDMIQKMLEQFILAFYEVYPAENLPKYVTKVHQALSQEIELSGDKCYKILQKLLQEKIMLLATSGSAGRPWGEIAIVADDRQILSQSACKACYFFFRFISLLLFCYKEKMELNAKVQIAEKLLEIIAYNSRTSVNARCQACNLKNIFEYCRKHPLPKEIEANMA